MPWAQGIDNLLSKTPAGRGADGRRRALGAEALSPVRVRSQIVLATLELAVSRNRWHVMNQAGAMLGQAADNGLVDRFLIELDLDSKIEGKLRRIETVVHWSRDRWHAKIAGYLSERDEGW